MTVEANSQPALDVPLTTLARCEYYRQLCGLHAEPELQAPHRIVLRIGGGVGAVCMGEDLGRRVQARLCRVRLGAPVIEHAQARRWTFLTGEGRVPDDTAHKLTQIGVLAADPGQCVVLPSLADEESGFRMWVFHPGVRLALPPMPHVVSATWDAAGRTSIRTT